MKWRRRSPRSTTRSISAKSKTTRRPELDVDPTLEKPGHEAQEAEYNDDSKVFEHKGGGTANGSKDAGASGGGGAMAFGPGPKVAGALGIGMGLGTGKNYGSGGDGKGFGGRGSGSREGNVGHRWRHQTHRTGGDRRPGLAGQSPGLPTAIGACKTYAQQCKPGTRPAPAPGDIPADAGATAMGLLPFLAAGQTHKSKGPYKDTVYKGIAWLIRNQQPDGNLAKGAQQMMYSHGLATIALCEAYGLTGDKEVGHAAQGAVNFILNAQNAADGGWRYNPGDPGDTSVVGWQLMALKSAHMAGLDVGGRVAGRPSPAPASGWIRSPYTMAPSIPTSPAEPPSNTMTSVGLLCRQYLGAKRDNPMLTGGMAYLMNHLPDEGMSQHLLLVLRDPGHAQHERIRVGHLESQDARFAGPHPGPQRRSVRQRQLGAGEGRCGASVAVESCRPPFPA